MQISSRFTIAVHIFSCIDTFEKDTKITSDFLAESVNVNPVIIRKILISAHEMLVLSVCNVVVAVPLLLRDAKRDYIS